LVTELLRIVSSAQLAASPAISVAKQRLLELPCLIAIEVHRPHHRWFVIEELPDDGPGGVGMRATCAKGRRGGHGVPLRRGSNAEAAPERARKCSENRLLRLASGTSSAKTEALWNVAKNKSGSREIGYPHRSQGDREQRRALPAQLGCAINNSSSANFHSPAEVTSSGT
jgi:hypothetical protein